jgi:hypothetical protein
MEALCDFTTVAVMLYAGRVDRAKLTDLERELLELCSTAPGMGETTMTVYEEISDTACDRPVVEAALRKLVHSGLMTTSRGTFAGQQHFRDGRVEHRVYEDDWWVLTEEGRDMIGLSPRKSVLD